MNVIVANLMTVLTPRSNDFSFFVAKSSKQQKQKTLKKAADKAIKEQCKIVDAYRS